MRIKIFTWTITSEKGRKRSDFWWTPDDGLIRPDCATSVFQDEFGNQKITREFYTLRSVFFTAATTPVWYLKQWFKPIIEFALAPKSNYILQRGAIAYDVGEHGGIGTDVSFSHTCSGNKRIVTWGGICYGTTTSHGFTGGTYDGSSADYSVQSNSTLYTARSAVWAKLAPPSGAKTVATTSSTSGSTYVGAISYTGAAQTDAQDDIDSGYSVTSSNSVDMTTTQNNTVVVMVAAAATSSSTTCSQTGTARAEYGQGGTRMYQMGDSFEASPTTYTATRSSGGNSAQGSISVIVLRSARPVGPFPTFLR